MFFKKLFITIVLLMSICVHSQNRGGSVTASVNSQFASDTANINLLLIKARNFYNKNQVDAGLNTALIAYDRSAESNYSTGLAKSIQLIYQLYFAKSDYKNALIFQLKSLELAEKEKNRSRIAMSYKGIAAIYQAEEHYEKSLQYYRLSYAEFRDLADSLNIAGVLTNKGLNYYQLAHNTLGRSAGLYTDSALADLTTSLKISKNNNYQSVTAANLGNLSEIFTTKKKYDIALGYCMEAIDNYKKVGDINGEATSLFDIGKIYQRTNQNNKALDYYQKSLKIANGQNNKHLAYYCYGYLADVCDTIGDFKSAYNYHKKMSFLKDSLINAEDMKQMNEMQTKYETEKKEALNKVLTDQNKLSEQTIKQQKTINYFIVGGLIMAIIFSIFIFNGLKKQRSANAIISRQKKDVELKNTEIEKQKELIEEKQKEIVDSINYAKRIQTSLLDNFDSVNKFFSGSFIFYKPKDIVSGDFYWLTKKMITERVSAKSSIVRELLFIAVCDSTGHGVPGGFMSLLNTAYLSEAINEKNIFEPNKIFDYVRNRLINTISKNEQKDGFDGVLLCFEKKSYFENNNLSNTEIKLTYAAAHNAPLIIRNGELIQLETDKMPVGYWDRTDNFTLFSFSVAQNDIVYAFTDGYADQFGGPKINKSGSFGKGKKFQYRQLYELLLSMNNEPIENQSNVLNEKFNDWKGNLEQVDDVLIIGIKI